MPSFADHYESLILYMDEMANKNLEVLPIITNP